MSDSTVVLVDGSSYLFRAYHALPPLTTSRGQPTGAVRGVINMLRKLQKDYPTSHFAVIFDAPGKTFRDDLYADYKANRPAMPDDLRAQIQPLHDFIRALGLPLICESGVEADDVIGTLANSLSADGHQVIISTGDKDMAQLVNPQVTLVNTMTNSVMDRAGVIDKFGIPPELIIDFLALQGDKVDNIPGVPGVGEKTALALLTGIGSLEKIYANLDQVATLDVRGAKSLAAKLEDNREQAFLSYQLATIKLDCELSLTLADLTVGDADKALLAHYVQELEFKGLAGELGLEDNEVAEVPAAVAAATLPYDILLDQASFDAWLLRLQQADIFSFDTETTSLDYMQAQIVGVNFAVLDADGIHAAYVPLAHDYPGAPEQLPRAAVLAQLKPLLEDAAKPKVGQHLKYDMNVLANAGISLAGAAFDTMLESYVLNATATRHDMDSLAKKYLARDTISFEQVAGKGAKQLTFNQVGIEEAGNYAAEDAEVTLALHQALWPQLSAIPSLKSVLTDIEMPLVPVLSRIERNGAYVDRQMLRRQSQKLAEGMQQLEQQAFAAAGTDFNLASTKQLGAILYDKLQLPVIKKTPKGAPSTAEEVLQELAFDHELPRLILEHRGLAKLKNTYTDKLPELVSERTGRLHTSYHQAVASTGRLSSTDPNLQNIPIKSEEGRKIRQAFCAPAGRVILACDYSQIELRIMAHLSGDEALCRAFAEGRDIHRATAAEVNGLTLDQVSDEDRRHAKAVNFGLIYGMSAFGLARQLGIPRQQAQTYIERYFARYPGVKTYMDATRQLAASQGFVETLFGRRLYLPEIHSKNAMMRQAAERTAINAPMQGTAADIIKRAMIAVDAWLAESGLDALMIMQVHDELVFEVAEKDLDAVRDGVCARMQAAADLAVPLLVSADTGSNWDEAH